MGLGTSSAEAPTDVAVLALDGIGLVATVGFFVPAAIVVMILAVVIIRDRRSPDEDDETSSAA